MPDNIVCPTHHVVDKQNEANNHQVKVEIPFQILKVAISLIQGQSDPCFNFRADCCHFEAITSHTLYLIPVTLSLQSAATSAQSPNPCVGLRGGNKGNMN